MSSTRSIVASAVFADSAATVIPVTPIPGVAYRNAALGDLDVEGGWPYAIMVDSAAFNQVMFQLTSLMQVMNTHGVLGWTNLVDYPIGALQRGSDGELYRAIQASGPSTLAQDPVAVPAYWANVGTPTGTVVHVAQTVVPNGYLKANGANVSRTTYARLFATIGTVFGTGDGSTTFALPDLRGEFARGWDDGRGIDSGRVFGSAQTDLIEVHTHDATFGLWNQDGVGNVASGGITNEGAYVFSTGSNTGGGTETRPRNVALMACIKI